MEAILLTSTSHACSDRIDSRLREGARLLSLWLAHCTPRETGTLSPRVVAASKGRSPANAACPYSQRSPLRAALSHRRRGTRAHSRAPGLRGACPASHVSLSVSDTISRLLR